LARGSALYAGDRLTLTAGYAEITTKGGAIAIFEAPTTIEMIDHENALLLHRGKLVGICETESSKGFVVRTPHLNVTDLGTRFGVVCVDRATRTTVLDGEIEVAAIGADATMPATQLIAGQSAQLEDGAEQVTRLTSASDRFVQDLRLVTHPVVTTGRVRYEPSIPRDLRVG
ncbi:unnamed protein product, partial [Ectocarpus sp. 4 AP-2014]